MFENIKVSDVKELIADTTAAVILIYGIYMNIELSTVASTVVGAAAAYLFIKNSPNTL